MKIFRTIELSNRYLMWDQDNRNIKNYNFNRQRNGDKGGKHINQINEGA